MRRDYGLIRELLRQLEEKPGSGHMTAKDFVVPGHDTPTITYHLSLMFQAGFINGEAIRSTTSPDRIIEVWPFHLTWQAHEFLAAARDDLVWRKVVRDLGGNFAAVPFSVLFGAAHRGSQATDGAHMTRMAVRRER